MNIRRAKSADSEALSGLVLAASRSGRGVDFTEEGWAQIEQRNTPEAFKKRFQRQDYFCLVCEIDNRIVGYMAMIDNEKIDHMFVLPSFWKKGISRKLWAEVLKECSDTDAENYYWVRSSTYAEPVYQSFGFRPKGDRQSIKGISFQFMELGSK